jgi:GrpB-like predicted nucleotidyltransferase (UPF0157 family)
MSAESRAVIGPYQEAEAAVCEYDLRAIEVARIVGALITEQLPEITVEHIGSAAVPGCAGKGIVDLMALYPDNRLEATKAALAALGFQRQSTRDPFPEDRPMRIGSFEFDGSVFRLHAHVIAAQASEAEILRRFRDRLRSDDQLREADIARKRAIIASGVTDTVDYSIAKGGFVQDALT